LLLLLLLLQITKMHMVIPDPQCYSELTDSGCPEQFVTVSLQLANNAIATAKTVSDLVVRHIDLLLNASSTVSLVSDDDKSSNSEQVDGFCADSVATPVQLTVCGICRDESPPKLDQLVRCFECKQAFHTMCVGLRKIPFGLKTEKDRESREAYVQRHFGEWKCEKCLAVATAAAAEPENEFEIDLIPVAKVQVAEVADIEAVEPISGGGVIVTEQVRTREIDHKSVESLIFSPSSRRSRGSSAAKYPASPSVRSKQDHVAILVAALAAANIGIDELLSMPEQQQRDLIMQAVSQKFPEWTALDDLGRSPQKRFDLAAALKTIISDSTNSNIPMGTSLMTTAARNAMSTPAARLFGTLSTSTSIGDVVSGTNLMSTEQGSFMPGRVGSGGGGSGGGGGGGSGSGDGEGNGLRFSGQTNGGGPFDARSQMLEFMKNRARGGGAVAGNKIGVSGTAASGNGGLGGIVGIEGFGTNVDNTGFGISSVVLGQQGMIGTNGGGIGGSETPVIVSNPKVVEASETHTAFVPKDIAEYQKYFKMIKVC
jgi:hypothetical protein